MIYVLVIIVKLPIGVQIGFDPAAAGWEVAPPPEVTRLTGVHPTFYCSYKLWVYAVWDVLRNASIFFVNMLPE